MDSSLDTRNVIDKFKGLANAEIKFRLSETAFPYACMMTQIIGDFNIGTMIRNANAFNASKVFYFGKKKYDPRGTAGTYHYLNIQHLKYLSDLFYLKEKYVFVGMENGPGLNPISMKDFDWPKNALIIFGEEGQGIPEDILNMCDYIVDIPMFGSVRSLNVGTTSGIAFHDYAMKYKS